MSHWTFNSMDSIIVTWFVTKHTPHFHLAHNSWFSINEMAYWKASIQINFSIYLNVLLTRTSKLIAWHFYHGSYATKSLYYMILPLVRNNSSGSPTDCNHCFWLVSEMIMCKFLSRPFSVQVTKGDKQLSESPSGRFQGSPHADKLIRVDVPDIVSVSACADLTLPPGAGLCIDTIHGPHFLVRFSVNEFESFFNLNWNILCI